MLGARTRLDSLGPTERWLVVGGGWRDASERALAPADASRALRVAVASGAIEWRELVAWLVAAELLAPVASRADARWRELDGLVARGRVLVIERPRALSRLGHAGAPVTAEDEQAAAREPEPLAPEPALATLVRVVEDRGPAVVGAGLELDVDGAAHSATTGDDGEARLEGLRSGPASLRLTGLDAVAWREPDEDPGAIGLGSRRVILDLRGEHEGRVGIRAAAVNLVVVTRPWLGLIVPDVARCDHDSALLIPAPWTEGRHPLAALAHALAHLARAPSWMLWVVGHASASGRAAANQALSEGRADGVRALLEGDEAGWVALARAHGRLRDVIAYLDYLARRRGWLCAFAGELADVEAASEATRETVGRFQADYNDRFDGELAVDGVVGVRTLAAVFAVLRDELARWLDKLGLGLDRIPRERVRFAGCGADRSGRAGGEAADRVVDFILVDDPAATVELEARELHASTVARRDELPLPEEPDEWATGPLTVVSDLTPDEPARAETYRLRSDDGEWVCEQVLPDDGVVRGGELTLRFEAVPTDRPLTLVVVGATGRESVIFEDRVYGALHRSRPTL